MFHIRELESANDLSPSLGTTLGNLSDNISHRLISGTMNSEIQYTLKVLEANRNRVLVSTAVYLVTSNQTKHLQKPNFNTLA